MQKIKSLKINKKKLWIITVSILIVVAVLIGLALWFKQSAESGAKVSIEKSHVAVGNALKTLNTKLADPKLTDKDRLGAFSQLDQALQKMSSDTCSVEAKNIMFTVSSAKKSCDDAHKKMLAIRAAAEKIQQSVKDDQTISAVLAPIQTADATAPAKQLEAWSTVESTISAAEISRDATNLQNHLLAVANAYKVAWRELIDADKAQNKANYNAAIKKLDAAKEELAKVATEQTTAFKNSLIEFKQAVSDFK